MKRRNFLKGILAAPAIAAVPALAKAGELKSDLITSDGGASWQPILQSEIDMESPIKRIVKINLEGDQGYSKEDVRELIEGINKELDGVELL